MLDRDDLPFPADAIYAALHHPEVFGVEASEGNIGRSVIVAAFRRALAEQGFDIRAAAEPREGLDEPLIDTETLAKALASVSPTGTRYPDRLAAEYIRLRLTRPTGATGEEPSDGA